MAGWDDIPNAKPKDAWDDIPDAKSPAPTPPQSQFSLGRIPLAGAGGFNVGLGNTLGMPVDIMNKVLSLGGLSTQQPIMGSEWIKQNIMPPSIKPEGFLETTAGAIGEQIPYGLSSMLFPGSRLMDVGKYALGAGTGSGIARSISPDNPYVDLAGQLIGGAGVPAIKTGVNYLTKPQNIQQIVEKGIQKGIKPSVINKSTSSEAQRYLDKARTGVETIIENKPNLQFIDETGTMIKGELPKSVKEFSQSIEQTRRSVFQEYNVLSRQAGQQPKGIDLTKVAKELDIIANNPVVLKEAPGTARYAKMKAEAYRNQVYNPEQAEQAIAINNRKLEVMPTQADANNAWIDKMTNDILRKELDNVIESAVGPGYQQLKNKYGALKTIEKDVTHRALIDARKNQAGLMDLPLVFTGFEAIRGILSGNPGMLVAAAGASGISRVMKHLVNPNRYIKSMFSNTEKMMTQPKQISPLTRTLPPSMMNIFQQGQRMEE